MSTVYSFTDPRSTTAAALSPTVYGALEAAAALAAEHGDDAGVGTTLVVYEHGADGLSVVDAIDAAAPLRDVVAQVTEWTGCGISTRSAGARLVSAAAAAIGLVLDAHGSAGRAATAESWLAHALAGGRALPHAA